MDDIAARHDATHEAIALAWLRQQPAVASIITGVKSADQLTANLKEAVDVTLSGEERKALDAAAPLTIEYPGWMLAQGGAGRAALLATGPMPTGD